MNSNVSAGNSNKDRFEKTMIAMRMMPKLLPVFLLLAAWPLIAGTLVAADDELDFGELDRQLEAVEKFKHGGDDKPLRWVEAAAVAAVKKKEEREKVEAALLRALASAKATTTARAFLCKQLRNIGTEASVPVLAKLLVDKDLSHPARIALAGMEARAAREALLRALDTATGNARIGVVNSLGRERLPACGAENLGSAQRREERARSQACLRPRSRASG